MTPRQRDLDLVVVGAGFAGLYMLHRARGLGLDVVLVEAADGVGGTWWWNRYPGARCDVESVEYSFSFDEDLQQEWEWSERYAPQPEILAYLEHVADRFDLRRDIRLGTRVTAVTWDDAGERWDVATDAGDGYRTRYVVMATGCLSMPMTPQIPGIEDFAGEVLHTGRWPHEGVDVAGLRVGVVGTGSSGVQSVPVLAEQASELTVFQRTAAFTVPAHNGALDPEDLAAIKADYPTIREANRQMSTAFGARFPRNDVSALAVAEEERLEIFEEHWARGGLPFLASFNDLLLDPEANDVAADYVRSKIRDVVEDPEVAERLSPDQVIGCKRMCVDSGYLRTFNQPHVHLVDVSEHPIERVSVDGIRTSAGHHDLDVIVLATGFDAMTGALARIAITGREGRTLDEEWSAGPHTLLGLAMDGFPNLFTVTGPGSPSVLTNMVVSIEHHVEWISELIAHADASGVTCVEADHGAQEEWVAYVNEVAGLTLFPTCSSWYLGANVSGKPRVFMPLPGFPAYAEHCAQVAADGYPGFTLT
ncbi:MAG: flavin-containing monooxygenase [Iamia sp.]